VDSDGWVPLIRQLESIVSHLAVLVSHTTTPQATLFQKRVDTLGIRSQAFAEEDSAVAWLKSLEA
jgi:hypothetical protein